MRTCARAKTRNPLKNVFWPNICVELLFQLLKIQEYSCGLKRELRLDLEPKSYF